MSSPLHLREAICAPAGDVARSEGLPRDDARLIRRGWLHGPSSSDVERCPRCFDRRFRRFFPSRFEHFEKNELAGPQLVLR